MEKLQKSDGEKFKDDQANQDEENKVYTKSPI